MKVKTIALSGMMLAVMLVLTFLEHTLPPLPFLPPGVSLGLSNVIVMYCVFFVGSRKSLLLLVLKSGFVLLTRGFMAGALSLAGGLLSFAVLVILCRAHSSKLSYIFISVCGAIAHNIGQLTLAAAFLGSKFVLAYLPVLVLSGIVFGVVTGLTLHLLLPVFHRTFPSGERDKKRTVDRN